MADGKKSLPTLILFDVLYWIMKLVWWLVIFTLLIFNQPLFGLLIFRFGHSIWSQSFGFLILSANSSLSFNVHLLWAFIELFAHSVNFMVWFNLFVFFRYKGFFYSCFYCSFHLFFESLCLILIHFRLVILITFLFRPPYLISLVFLTIVHSYFRQIFKQIFNLSFIR